MTKVAKKMARGEAWCRNYSKVYSLEGSNVEIQA